MNNLFSFLLLYNSTILFYAGFILSGVIIITGIYFFQHAPELIFTSGATHHIYYPGEGTAQSNCRFNTLCEVMDQVGEAFFIVDPISAKVLFSNRTACEHFGYDHNEMTGLTCKDILLHLVECEEEEWSDMINYLKTTNLPLTVRSEHKCKNGNWLPVTVAFSMKEIGGDEYLLVTVQNTSLLREEADKLRHSEQRYKMLVETMYDGICVVDKNNVIAYINRRFETMLGYSKDELIGKKFEDNLVYDPDDVSYINRITKERARGFSNQYEIQLVRKDAKLVWTSISVSPIKNEWGEVIGSLGVITDISDRKKMEEELRFTRDTLSNIFKSLDKEIFWSYDIKTKSLLYSSPEAKRVIGYSIDDFFKQKDLWKKVVHKADHKLARESLIRLFNGEPIDIEYRIVSKYREIKWLKVHCIPVKNDFGELVRMDGLIMDISVKKTMEQQIIEKNKELNMFIYKASHDLKAPMASVMGLVNVAKKEIHDPNALTYFKMINSSMQRLDSILLDLTEINMISQHQLCVSEIDFEKEIDTMLENLAYYTNYEKVQFTVNVDKSGKFFCDRKLIFSVLQNLIVNSIKYHNYSQKQPIVEINVRKTDRGFQLEVADNGTGIKPELQERIFDMFFRATTDSKGTGLGLYIVKNAVEKMKGKIQVYSVYQQGSTFTVFIPDAMKLDNSADNKLRLAV